MARPDSPGMIDGFMSVQAVRHQGERPPDEKPPKDAAPAAKAEESRSDSALPQKQASIGQTALPSRHELICYSCGYAFVITGSLNKVFCPKCREQLETSDRTIEGEWKEDIRTVGRVHVHQGATVIGATIVATDVIIAGDCTQAKLQPTRRIELDTGARVQPEVLNEHSVHVIAGARLSLTAILRCNMLEIFGELQASAEPTGMTTVHPGGMFRGTLKTEHLTVHDGGGLSASLHIAPAPPEAPPEADKTADTEAVDASASPSATKAKKPTAPSATKKAAPSGPTQKASSQTKATVKRVSSTKGKKRASKRPRRKVE